MGMGENDEIYLPRVETKVAVRRVGLHAFALIHAAVEQYTHTAVGGDKVFAAGNLIGSAEELYFHGIMGCECCIGNGRWNLKNNVNSK